MLMNQNLFKNLLLSIIAKKCEKKFENKRELRRHLVTAHETMACKICKNRVWTESRDHACKNYENSKDDEWKNKEETEDNEAEGKDETKLKLNSSSKKKGNKNISLTWLSDRKV